jgi:hypothetical protein
MLAGSSVAAAVPGPHGVRFDVGGYRLFLECSGTGSPAAILDAGLGADHTEWSAVQPEVAATTTVCAWDRAGLGNSDPRPEPGPVGTERVVSELHTLLERAGIAGPFVLVGHSIGGIDMRLYQLRYPASVVGLVLAEGTPEQQYLTGSTVDRNDGEVMQLGAAARALEHSSLPPQLPLVVLERAEDTDPVWQAEQAALSVRSPDSLLILAMHSDHAVEQEQPALVAAAIQTVVGSIRLHTALKGCPAPVTRAGGRCLPAGSAPPGTGIAVSVPVMAAAAGLLFILAAGAGVMVGRSTGRRVRAGHASSAVASGGVG